jgi:hypothetical protein
MATCLNLNDPQVKAITLRFGEVATSKILDVYNEKYSNREFTPDLATSIYNQIRLEKQSYVHPIIGKNLNSLDEIKTELEKTEDFYGKLRVVLNATNWKSIIDSAKKAEIKGISPIGASRAFEELQTETDIQKIAEGILTYFYENQTYLNELSRALRDYLQDESIPVKERGATAYFASQLATQLKNSIQDWKPYLNTLITKNSDNFIKKSFDNIEEIAERINRINRNFSIPRVAEELANNISQQSERLKEFNEKQKAKLLEEKARLERLQAQGATNNRKKIISNIDKAIAELNRRATQYATKENIKKALGEEFENQDHISWLSYWFESAQLSSNILAGSTGNFIWNMQTEADQKSQKFQNQMAKLIQKALDHFKVKKGLYLMDASGDALFDTYVREVEIVFVNENGELDTYKDFALQSKNDEIGYKNEKVKREHAITQKKLAGEDTFAEEEALARFVEANEERGLTEEYYRIMSSLSLKAKKARKEIIEKMKLLESRDRGDILNDIVIEQMEDLRFQLERLESLVYLDVTAKKGDDLEIAQDIRKWKESTKAAELFTYEPDAEKTELWISKMKEYKSTITKAEQEYKKTIELYKKGEVTAGAVGEARKAIATAKKSFDSWAKTNVRRSIDSEWYKERRELLDAVSEIQSKYTEQFENSNINLRTSAEIWDEIFNILKGYRNSDGIYVGTNIPLDLSKRIKELQQELNVVKDEYKKAKLVSEQDKNDLDELYAQLDNIQKRQTTEYYKAAYNNALGETRAQVVADYMRLNPDLVLNYKAYLKSATTATEKEFPNLTNLEIGEIAAKRALDELYEKEALLNTQKIDEEVLLQFKKSNWYKTNHMRVQKYDPISRRTVPTYEPLYFWNEVLPWDSENQVVDEAYINRETPSFRWSTFRVNDQVLDPQTGKPLFVNPDYKYIPGRTQLRPTTEFQNDSYSKLDSTEEEILKELQSMNEQTQENLPTSLRRGLLLPSVRKDKFTNLGQALNPLDQLKLAYTDIKDRVLGINEEDEDSLNGEKISSRVHRRMYLKYSSRMESSLKSKNVFASLAMFNHEAERFKVSLKNAPVLFGLEDILSKKDIGKGNKGVYTIKMINNLYEKQLYGVETKDGTGGRILGLLTDPVLSLGRKLSLNYNLPSAIKNWVGNVHNVMIQAGEFDLTPGEIWAGMGEGAMHIKDLFLADRDVRVGRESDYVKMLDYFHVFPKQHAEQLRNIINNPLRETASYSPLSLLRFGRNFLEMEATIGVYEALLKKFTITNNLGEKKTLKDAYEVVDGEIRIKPEFNEEEVKAIESYFMKKLHSITAIMQGAYAKIDQSELRRYALGRLLGYMRTWIAYQSIRRYGGRRISYGGGYEYEGFYRAVVRESLNVMKALFQGKEGLQAYMVTLDPVTRRALRGALYDSLAIVVGMAVSYALSGLIKGDGDDKDNKGTYFLLYNLAYVLDELETLHPAFGPASIWYGRVSEKNTQVNILQHYFSKNVLLPYKGVYDILREAYTFSTEDTYNLFDEYVPRNAKGERITRRGIPINPALEGNSNIVSQFLKTSKLANNLNYIFNPEYQYRTWTHYNPKYFLQSTKEEIENTRGSIKQLKNKIKALNIEINESDDPEYQAELRRAIDQNREELFWKSKEQMGLLSQMEDDIIQ